MLDANLKCPCDDGPALWRLQWALIAEAEAVLGGRDSQKKIYQPQFDKDGPRLINTPELDGAFSQLSFNSARSWRVAIYEMAHETVHLLDPTVGYTSWLEEGAAVAFSIAAQQRRGVANPISPILQSYVSALDMFRSIPGDPFKVARAIRSDAGALKHATESCMAKACPGIDTQLARLLVSQCVPR